MQTTNKKRPGKKEPTVDELLAAIAKATLRIDTLETRKSDSLDFHDVAVWSVKAALEAAYRAWLADAKEARCSRSAPRRPTTALSTPTCAATRCASSLC